MTSVADAIFQPKLRGYQTRMAATSAAKNSVVLLPTGSGKTLIAAETTKLLKCQTLFLVPKRLLVPQQSAALRQWTGRRVAEYMGGEKMPKSIDILVSTPKAFDCAQRRLEHTMPQLKWRAFGLVVFDEVHHVLKDHPYRKLALSLQRSGASPRILGLTASLTYAVTTAKVQECVRRICLELKIEAMLTATDAELREDGYHGSSAVAEVLTDDKLISGFAETETDRIIPLEKRKPHLMLPTFLQRVARGKATKFALDLMKCIRRMEAALGYESPIGRVSSMYKWAKEAFALGGNHSELAQWYEALRILITSWEEAVGCVLLFLQMMRQDSDGFVSNSCLRLHSSFSRFRKLKAQLLAKHKQLPHFRGIVFVQRRVMTHILQHFISTDSELKALFTSACLYATSSPATVSLAVSKKEASQRLEAFGSGRVNLLLATVVAEEGMDIPAANVVIRFDAVQHSVSLVQGRGRARETDSRFVVLEERTDRSVADLLKIEAQQRELVTAFDPAKVKLDAGDLAKMRTAQASRERDAVAKLRGSKGAQSDSALLNLFCKKTKVQLTESFGKASTGEWRCELQYHSILRECRVHSAAPSKRESKRAAAAKLLRDLKRQLGF